ncbi:hypothetical protein BD413DRAFT_283821 [Trametes elegans]|nr:hypothetical protein BD413DRAFT_283821 [Trametes elegans]
MNAMDDTSLYPRWDGQTQPTFLSLSTALPARASARARQSCHAGLVDLPSNLLRVSPRSRLSSVPLSTPSRVHGDGLAAVVTARKQTIQHPSRAVRSPSRSRARACWDVRLRACGSDVSSSFRNSQQFATRRLYRTGQVSISALLTFPTPLRLSPSPPTPAFKPCRLVNNLQATPLDEAGSGRRFPQFDRYLDRSCRGLSRHSRGDRVRPRT